MPYDPHRNGSSPPCFLKVWRAKDDFTKFECGRQLEVRSREPGTMTIIDVANEIVIELPDDGKVVFHEDEHGTTIDTLRPLTLSEGERTSLKSIGTWEKPARKVG